MYINKNNNTMKTLKGKEDSVQTSS